MENMGSSERRQRRSYSRAFKDDVVNLVRGEGRSIRGVSKDLDLAASSVRSWVHQAEIDDGDRGGLKTSEREELGRLRREVLVLREERDILKRATAFFARETR